MKLSTIKRRAWYNEQIINYCLLNNITYVTHSSRCSDYYFITSIDGKGKHTLKIRISNHATTVDKDWAIPFFNCHYLKPTSTKCIYHNLEVYINKYKMR